MTGLLVSVRSAVEAAMALAAGVDWIDVKEPQRGSLGAASPRVWAEVAECVHSSATLSLALGELVELDLAWCARVPPQYAYAKLGLAGCAAQPWPQRLATAWRALPAGVQPVAVIYADWHRASAPAPCDVLAAAATLGCRAVLIDTAVKDGSTLLNHYTAAALAALVRQARGEMDVVVLAGSLSHLEIAAALPLAPDYFAVRGAVCAGGRTGVLDAKRIQHLLALLREPARR